MVAVVPNPRKIRSFRDEAAFEKWLAENHARETEVWVRIFKKDSGVASVTHAQAVDVALCWGWIDAIRKPLDAAAFLQRFTPRKKKSIWSHVNREHVARLTAAGRMAPPGQRAIDAAKADGRWEAAYAPMRNASAESLPADLRAAIDANPRALKTLGTLDRQNLFSLIFRTNNMKTAAGRAKKIAALVATLASGKPIVPPRSSTRKAASAGTNAATRVRGAKRAQRPSPKRAQRRVAGESNAARRLGPKR